MDTYSRSSNLFELELSLVTISSTAEFDGVQTIIFFSVSQSMLIMPCIVCVLPVPGYKKLKFVIDLLVLESKRCPCPSSSELTVMPTSMKS